MINCPDIARQVFGHVEDKDLSACTQVCKSWKDALYAERFFWTRRLKFLLSRNIYPNDTCFGDEDCECQLSYGESLLCDVPNCPKLEILERSISDFNKFSNIFRKIEKADTDVLKNICLHLIRHMKDNADQAWVTIQKNETVIFGPLHVAVFRRDIEFLNLLLNLPDLTKIEYQYDVRGISSFMEDHPNSCQIAFVYDNVASDDEARFIHYDDTPLEMAVRKGYFEVVELMVKSHRFKSKKLRFAKILCTLIFELLKVLYLFHTTYRDDSLWYSF